MQIIVILMFLFVMMLLFILHPNKRNIIKYFLLTSCCISVVLGFLFMLGVMSDHQSEASIIALRMIASSLFLGFGTIGLILLYKPQFTDKENDSLAANDG